MYISLYLINRQRHQLLCLMKKHLIGLLLFAMATVVQGQQKYWIYLKDKTHFCEEEQHLIFETDTLQLVDFNIKPIVYSKWLKAFSAIVDSTNISFINTLPVSKISAISSKVRLCESDIEKPINFARVLDQIEADTLLAMGLSGKGIKIGVIDAGFLYGDKDPYLVHAWNSDRLLGYKNFIEKETVNAFDGNQSNNDNHGTRVLKAIIGKTDNSYGGLATSASLYLARTDQADREYRGEEDYWVAALEWMYDNGVRLVNSSLGYSIGFDDPDENYSQNQINGEFSTISKVANIAVKEKGMIIVVSAGNEGNDDFRIISVPADASDVISVGASGHRYWNKLDYSSIGPEHLSYVKPEIVCFASGGTSFSAPVITGLIACMMEYDQTLKPNEIRDILFKSSHLYPYANNYLGFGVPNVKKIVALLNDKQAEFNNSCMITAQDSLEIEMPKSYNIMAFHKKDKHTVVNQEKLRWSNNGVIVYKKEEVKITTVSDGISTWEIIWD